MMYILFLHETETHLQEAEGGVDLNTHYCVVLRMPFLHWGKIILYNYL